MGPSRLPPQALERLGPPLKSHFYGPHKENSPVPLVASRPAWLSCEGGPSSPSTSKGYRSKMQSRGSHFCHSSLVPVVVPPPASRQAALPLSRSSSTVWKAHRAPWLLFGFRAWHQEPGGGADEGLGPCWSTWSLCSVEGEGPLPLGSPNSGGSTPPAPGTFCPSQEPGSLCPPACSKGCLWEGALGPSRRSGGPQDTPSGNGSHQQLQGGWGEAAHPCNRTSLER